MGEILLNLVLDEGRTSRIERATQELDVLKESLLGVMKSKRLNLQPFNVTNDQLLNKAKMLHEKISESKSRIEEDLREEIKGCTTEINQLSSTMSDIKLHLDIINRVIAFNSTLTSLKDNINRNNFHKSALCLEDLDKDMTDASQFMNLTMFILLKQDAVLLREKLLFDMAEIWEANVMFDTEMRPDYSVVTIKVQKGGFDVIKEIIQAVFHMGDSLITRRFFNKIKEKVLLPLINNASEVSNYENDATVGLVIKLFLRKNSPHYMSVFKGISTVIEFVRNNFNITTDDGVDFVSEMGKNVAQEVTSCLMKNCLPSALPNEPGQIDSFGEVVANAESLQLRLQSLGFLPQNSSPFIEHAHDVNLLFANKMYISYLSRAREIMKMDLHSVTTSREIAISDFKVLPDSAVKVAIELLNLKRNDSFVMAECTISKSAQEVINLVEAIVKELKKSEDSRAVRLLYTIRNMFEMYGAVVPMQHRKLLDTIPQQVAVFHNNCLYFAHYSMRLAFECYRTWPNILKEEYHIFLDQAVSLRQLAIYSLESCVSNQRSQLLYILRDSGLGNLSESVTLDGTAEKAVRQCLRQLQLLCNVWTNVLPNRIFENALAFLVDAFTEEIISLVLAAEDISSHMASELVIIFKIAQDRMPSLFNEPKEVYRICRKWGKFREFILLLAGSLGNISDRWSDGVGPLSCEFTADQVKHLIRALFQNTERRAALISRIK